ncbi:MAG: site-specific DNA-methyltransferase [Bacteroidaceae bacterium]|nr:site-specific DNA-methyltransferase [Bacteroidaceae bacterium]
MMTSHSIYIGASQHMNSIKDNTVDLVVTSPPYPMIEMWDEIMTNQNPQIADYLQKDPEKAFELMHKELDLVWKDCLRVLKPGGFLCINIGDATRTINGNFTLYNNHSRISKACFDLGFVGLPNIIWRKQTNAPNKFMGSGMLPCGAYVTLEHEWILVFRKGDKRAYKTADAKLDRMKSSFFWEERNVWFSDVWEIKGTKQNLLKTNTRERSAAFPFEVPYRLINMFSQKGDTVLDPFLGTGTTMQAAIITGRNSCGYDIDANFEAIIREGVEELDLDLCNALIKKRFDSHKEFVENREKQGKDVKHFNNTLNYKVMTKQESEIELNYLTSIKINKNGEYVVEYEEHSDLNTIPFKDNIFAITR